MLVEAPVVATGAIFRAVAIPPEVPKRSNDTAARGIGRWQGGESDAVFPEQSGKGADAIAFAMGDVMPIDILGSLSQATETDAHEITRQFRRAKP